MRDSGGVVKVAVSGRRRTTGLAARINKIGLAAGAALAVTVCAATGAQAQCTSTVPSAGGVSASSFTPFAMGSAVNSLATAINAADTVFLTQSSAFISAPANPAPNQTGGGIWARSIGGEQTTKGTATSNYSLLGVPLPGSTTCRTSTQVTFGGVQIGTDISTLNLAGWNLHAGSTLGYLGAGTKDTTSPGPANPAGGTFSDNLQIPFIGGYAAATKGNFFVDGQVRWLYFQNALTNPQDGLFSQHLDARGYAINGDVGYHFALPGNWFVEPSGGFIWSDTSIAPLNTTGTLVLGTGLSLPGTVSFSHIYNEIGRVSARVGTTIDGGNIIWQPFGTASFFREFRGDSSATITGLGGLANGTLSTTGIGNYGQFGLGVAGQIKDTGWLGYVRGDYRTGDSIQGWSLNAGLRYQFSPGVLRPLIIKGPEPAVESTPYNWTGFRVGAALGAEWGYTNWNFPSAGTGTSPRFAGVLPGGFVGYDYQIGKWVLGAGADLAWTNANGASSCPNGFFFTCQNKSDWLGTATGRVGYAFWGDRVLTYVKAGLALGDFSATINCNSSSLLPLGAGCPSQGVSKTSAGWTIGAGTEFALTNNWSVRSESGYYNLGTDHYGPLTLAGGTNTVNVTHQGFMATIGLAYRFDFGAPPTPVVAKY